LLLADITIDKVERRFLRACKTIRALPDLERRFLRHSNGWPDYVRDHNEAYGYSEAAMPRFRPKPFDVSDVLTALAWGKNLQRNEWKLVEMRSFDLSFGQIGRRIGKSDETARRYYRDVMLKIWSEANIRAIPGVA
jgi:hypothetical protein